MILSCQLATLIKICSILDCEFYLQLKSCQLATLIKICSILDCRFYWQVKRWKLGTFWRISIFWLHKSFKKSLFSIILEYRIRCCKNTLTLKWPRYFHFPWCPRPTPKKITFPPDCFNYFYTMYMYTNHNHIPAKKCCIISKWRSNNQFLFHVISILAKNLKKKKTLSQRNFSVNFGS